jgi:hypothetical protein
MFWFKHIRSLEGHFRETAKVKSPRLTSLHEIWRSKNSNVWNYPSLGDYVNMVFHHASLFDQIH